MPQLDVEALDAALGGVSEDAHKVRRSEILVLHDDGEAVEAAARATLQRVEHLARVVVREEVDVEARGRMRPAAPPEVAPPLGESRCADGILEREVRTRDSAEIRTAAAPSLVWISCSTTRRGFDLGPPLLAAARSPLRTSHPLPFPLRSLARSLPLLEELPMGRTGGEEGDALEERTGRGRRAGEEAAATGQGVSGESRNRSDSAARESGRRKKGKNYGTGAIENLRQPPPHGCGDFCLFFLSRICKIKN
jgi:hypothetical protein